MSKYVEIFGADWARVLKPFLQSEDWQTIRGELKKNMSNSNPMYPAVDDIFRAFKLCPYRRITTVFLTTNPYDTQNDGLAFSSKSASIFTDHPKVLDSIFNAVEEDVCNGVYLNRDSDLQRWAEQGVLLLNCDLTAVKGKPGAHLKMWHPMIKYIFKHMGEFNTGILYVLIGTHAQKFGQYINKEVNDIYNLEHPMIAVKEKRPWKHQNIFSTINRVSKFLNNHEIDWTKTINPWDKPLAL